MYLKRIIENTLTEATKTFPAIVISGPRQSGKTTLLKNFVKKGTFLTLDDPFFRSLLSENPIDYLDSLQKPVIIDEIQYMPELTQIIKILIDRDRTPGNWYITGSQQFSVMKSISESLAGRAAILSLPTFSFSERKTKKALVPYLLESSYPEPLLNKIVNQDLWYSSYLQTYLERDVRSLMNIDNLRDFEQFIRLLASRTATQLNYSSISNDLGLSVPTVKRWISILEASYIIYLLPPFYKNYGKRLIKAPKIYFLDPGLVNVLIGIKDKTFLVNGPMAGAIFENALISEMVKKEYARGIKPEMYYWRSQSGKEIDLIMPINGEITPFEIKLSSNIKPLFYKNLQYWLGLSGQKNNGYLLTNCSKKLPLPSNIRNLYWKDYF
jgi:predicted AAA+ superfamily ATPase